MHGQGRKAIKIPPRKITQPIRLTLHRPGITTTKLAWKFDIHQSSVLKIFKKEDIYGKGSKVTKSKETKLQKSCIRQFFHIQSP